MCLLLHCDFSQCNFKCKLQFKGVQIIIKCKRDTQFKGVCPYTANWLFVRQQSVKQQAEHQAIGPLQANSKAATTQAPFHFHSSSTSSAMTGKQNQQAQQQSTKPLLKNRSHHSIGNCCISLWKQGLEITLHAPRNSLLIVLLVETATKEWRSLCHAWKKIQQHTTWGTKEWSTQEEWSNTSWLEEWQHRD